MANKLNIIVETGERKDVNVFDIIDSYAFNKTFIIYNFDDEPNRIFASVLNESDLTANFDPITDPEEQKYISLEIDRVANELRNAL